MSKPQDAQRISFPFGNAFRMIRPKGSYISPKLLALQTSFEQTLAESLRKLKPRNASDVLSLSWMRSAMQLISDTHTNITALTTALQFPVPDWDEKWMDMYLNDSIKLLDICNALTSELSRLDQSQLLLKYALHIMGSASTSPSCEQLNRVHSSLHEWMEQIHSRNLKLENSSSILQDLTSTLHPVKVKNLAKGKVLMRALYGVKAETIFVCSVITAALSGSPKPLMDLHVSDEFLWADAFDDLKAGVYGNIRNSFSPGKKPRLKELDAINACVEKIHKYTTIPARMEENQPSTDVDAMGEAEKHGWMESASDLGKSAENFTHEIDLLSKQLEEFFHLVLGARNTLLSSLRSDVQFKKNSDKGR